MKVKELKEMLKNIDDNEEIEIYVFDYEYDSENPQDLGGAKIMNIKSNKYGNYIEVGLNKN